MSLTDGLLLDPQKLDVWIALRTDSVKGSGTESDPFDGTPIQAKPIDVSTLTHSAREATVNTGGTSHGYLEGDVVTIAGVTGAGAPYYNGTFPIYSVTTYTFKYYMGADPGASAGGAITCSKVIFQFDDLMRTMQPSTTIHLGPGVFQTRGFALDVGGWQAAAGQKIQGSGMYLTTLKIVYATVANKHYYAVANNINATNTLDYFEASDFTVDCNLGGQPVPMGSDFAPLACSALSIRGSHIRYRRIRAINFGTQGVPECFAMIAGWAHPAVTEIVDCVIEDCVLEQPSLNNTHETTIIGFGTSEDSGGDYSYPRACVIRNCLVDCEYKVNPVAISGISISISVGVATVTTRLSHGRSDGDWVVITGALVDGSDKNTYNGSYQISVDPRFPSQFTYTPVAYGGLPVPTTNPTGDMWVGRFSSHYVSISSVTKTGTGPWTVKLVTATPHFRVPGNNVVVGNVATSPASPNAFNGSFLVADTANFDPVTLEFVFSTDPGAPSASPSALIGVEFHGAQADAGTAAVVEGNRIYNCRLGNYGDTGSTKDSIIRNNHFRAVASGPLRNLGRTNDPKTGVLLKLGGVDNKTATFTTQMAHGLQAGQVVRIQNAHILGIPVPDDGQTYNGFFAVDSVPTSTSFTYRMITAPAADADTTPSANLPTFATLWQVGLIVIENNLIELIPSINNWGAPVGVQFYQPSPTGLQYVFRKAIIRNNVIRFADGASDQLQFALGIRLWNCESAIVEDNIVDLDAPKPDPALQL